MRIAIQTPSPPVGSAGQAPAGIYAANLLRALRAQRQEDSFVTIDEGEAWWRRGRARLRSVDICHSIGQVPPARAAIPLVPLIADLAPIRHPNLHSLCTVRHFTNFLDHLDRFAAIQTLTEFTRAELVAHTGIDADRVAVLPPGVDELFHAPGQPEDVLELQAIGLLPQQFFLSVGCLHPLGNFATLAAAYCALPQRVKILLPLVIAGDGARSTWPVSAAVQAEIDAGNIRLLGHVPRFLLRVLYRGALLALFPAIYGGFGLSVAEALVCGAPIAVGLDTAFAELAGPLAQRIDPLDVAGWEMVLADQVGRGRFAGPGALRAAPDAFSWSSNAEKTFALYARVLN